MTRTVHTIRATTIAAAIVAAATLLASTGCTGSDAKEAASGISATLEIITTQIQSSIGGDPYAKAEAGQTLTVGDKVKTDQSGFAELTYHDGSWQRVENNATLTIEDLAQKGDENTVRTSIDVGRTWNRVQELTEPEDEYEVETPVATASVRGTVFATDCPTPASCTFSVLEGTVVVTPLVGDPVTVTAPATLEVVEGVAPGEPTVVAPDVLRHQPWAEKNLGLDVDKIRDSKKNGNGGDEQSEASPTEKELHAARLEGTYDAARTGITSNYQPDHPNYVEPGTTTQRTYTVENSCTGSTCKVDLSADPATGGAPLTFDGTAYLQREELPSDCIDDTTQKPIASNVARIVVEATWTPTDAELVDGEWVITEFTGSVGHHTEIINADAFAEQCAWPTTDGAPPEQTVSVKATRE